MMKNNAFAISLGIAFFVLLCSSCNNLKSKYLKYKDQINDVWFVEIYSMTPNWTIEGDAPPEFSWYFNLMTEEEIRADADFKATLYSSQKDCFMAYLYSAEKCDVKNNKVRIKNGGFWMDGIVIDVHYDDTDRGKDVYIMQNGEQVFYKKGEEGIYYKMPRQILEKYRFYCN